MMRPDIVGVDGLVGRGVLAFSTNGRDWCEERRNVVWKGINEGRCRIGGLDHSEISTLIGWGGDRDVVAAGDILEDFWCCRRSAAMSASDKGDYCLF